MNPGTVRLQVLSDITGRPREAIRNAQKADAAPWNEDDFAEGQHRRFNGFHALALVLSEGLLAQRCSMEQAGEAVRANEGAINLFLDEVAEATEITPRFIMAMQIAIEDSWHNAPRWEQVIATTTGTADEIQKEISRYVARVGQVVTTRSGRSEERVIGGPNISIVSIPEMYRLLRQRAEAAGYIVDGRRILKIADEVESE